MAKQSAGEIINVITRQSGGIGVATGLRRVGSFGRRDNATMDGSMARPGPAGPTQGRSVVAVTGVTGVTGVDYREGHGDLQDRAVG